MLNYGLTMLLGNEFSECRSTIHACKKFLINSSIITCIFIQLFYVIQLRCFYYFRIVRLFVAEPINEDLYCYSQCFYICRDHTHLYFDIIRVIQFFLLSVIMH